MNSLLFSFELLSDLREPICTTSITGVENDEVIKSDYQLSEGNKTKTFRFRYETKSSNWMDLYSLAFVIIFIRKFDDLTMSSFITSLLINKNKYYEP